MSLIINIPLVDDQDNIIGHAEKLDVHVRGLLHRAFSILVFNEKKEILIHQRAFSKYHSPGLWTNTCCGHPNEGESMESAVHRRLFEEMGFDCDLKYSFTFRYLAKFDNGLTENEIDHVYTGEYNEDFTVNPDEVADYKWLSKSEIINQIAENPENFTVWFREIMKKDFNF
ncbi:isopentenyl-diphosphate Delta-isomerase [Lacihabitans sp. LS3-19]|uniref:isopentenyl-diphosphate Delta-isomerase n=1 Tax=Lacihabitans sp. LS3-19 TaxID=2487335 RepID=UPI0020CF61C2|nr:isopentenyl-diphosphate Delta-isomerase [Lacihabitans sp. LS3-19]MCP9766705.1 isopentenyl-diphosphate Delta-isomerase [Lacihabitans sp. LS3-19]